jgi:hypothetical protein
MGRKSRELLKELLGEENFERYENGDAVGIESPDGYTYKIERRQGYADIVRSRPSSRYSYSSRDSGRLRAFDIDDGIATFIEHARLGQVSWKCGNIDIDLPTNMPPKNTDFTTFLFRGIKTIIYYLKILPREYLNWVRTGDTFIASMGTFAVWIGLALPIAIGAKEGWWPDYVVGSWFFSLLPIGMLIGYIRWKNQWEVKLG